MKTLFAFAAVIFACILSSPILAAQEDARTLFKEGSRSIHRIKIFRREINRIDRGEPRNRETADVIEALKREREVLRRDVAAEQKALLKILHQCDDRLEGILRTPMGDRTKEENRDAFRLLDTKTKAIGVIGTEGLPYVYDNFFFCHTTFLASRQVKDASLFVDFPCVTYLSRMVEPSAVQAVMHLVQRADLKEDEQVFCARFLYEDARKRSQNNEQLRNRLSKESAELAARIKTSLTASPNERASDLEHRINRNVKGILTCYDHILEDNNSAMQKFSEVRRKMVNAHTMRWTGQE